MQIKFKKLRYQNFLSSGNVWTEIDLVASSLTLIIGKNGGGKSTVTDAITFALFNKAFRKINKPQLVNSVTKKNCLVELEFDIGVSEYKVVRGIKPNVFEVYKDGLLLNQNIDPDEYQTSLEQNILKSTYKSFCQIVILGNASYTQFMSLKTPERRKFIEDILDLNVFSVMNELLKKRVNDNSSRFVALTNTKGSLEEKIKLVKAHIEESKKNNDEIVAKKKQEMLVLVNRGEAAMQELEALDEEIKELDPALASKPKVVSRLNDARNMRRDTVEMIGKLTREINFYHDHDDCPTCQQEISPEFKEKEIVSKTNEISDLSDEKLILDKTITSIEEQLSQMNEVTNQITAINIRKSGLFAEINSIDEQTEKLEAEIKTLETKAVDTGNEARLVRYQTELTATELEYAKEGEIRKTNAVAALLLKDTGIKAQIVKQYVPVINAMINDYLTKMEFFVKFTLDENFDETIHSKHKNDFSYESFSEGEKVRLNLAILFTWRAIAKMRNSINTNLLIMDETLDGSLDEIGINGLLEILEGFKEHNTFVISHRLEAVDGFDRILMFSKTKNFSSYVEV